MGAGHDGIVIADDEIGIELVFDPREGLGAQVVAQAFARGAIKEDDIGALVAPRSP